MSRDEIEAIVTAFGDLARIVQHADPRDKAEIYAKLRLTLTYEPTDKLVQAVVKFGLNMPKGFVSEALCPRPELNPDRRDPRISAT